MTDAVTGHYSGSSSLARQIEESLRSAGKSPDGLHPEDLAPLDEFHIRGRKATLEIAAQLNIDTGSHVLDIGSGLGGPARTVAQTIGCRVTGVDLTPAFCEAATVLSGWLRLGDRVSFQVGDATKLPFSDGHFDAAMNIHVAMNIREKDKLYSEARRVLKRGARFAVYDVLQGEGGPIHYPVPWARDASISFLATPDQMQSMLTAAGFSIKQADDSTEEGQEWFQAVAARMAKAGGPPVTFRAFLGNDFSAMAANQVRNLVERRIRTVTYICEA